MNFAICLHWKLKQLAWCLMPKSKTIEMNWMKRYVMCGKLKVKISRNYADGFGSQWLILFNVWALHFALDPRINVPKNCCFIVICFDPHLAICSLSFSLSLSTKSIWMNRVYTRLCLLRLIQNWFMTKQHQSKCINTVKYFSLIYLWYIASHK